ncbi:MAG: hypothetical protein HY291_04020 [Planctomycetes bacterium]|nr:hypothetical protein [Planctomycetota bacterium]
MTTMETDAKPETAAAQGETPTAPAQQTAEAPKRDRWLVPLCALSLILWGLFIFTCMFAVPEYRTLYDRLKSDPPFITRVVMGFRHPEALAILAFVSLVFTAAAHLSKNRSAALALVIIAALLLGGSFAALHIPYLQVREQLVR